MNRQSVSQGIVAVVLLITGVMGLGGFPQAARATEVGPVIDIGFFYDRLAPYGDWAERAPYGWVWYPRHVSMDWRPYTVGHWVYTDDYGWLWDSDEPWGWACFHYGRWGWESNLGWFWVPGSYWAPAWVVWRTGPDFIGWCPLPPAVGWQASVGLELHGLDLDDLPARRWVFVETRYFDTPRLHRHIMLVDRNLAFMRETRAAVRFERIDGRIVNRPLSTRQVEEFTHRRVERFRVRHVESPAAMRAARERAGEINMFSPRVQRGPAGVVPPQRGELERRQSAQRAQLQEQQQAERRRQEQRHQAERAAPHMGAEPLHRQQEAERQALQAEHQRQQRTLENRQRQERQTPGHPAGTPPAQGRGERR
jgi:hypothetical protein